MPLHFRVRKHVDDLDILFEGYEYYHVTFTEEEITIDTDVEKNIQKWQEVSVLSFDGDLCSFKTEVPCISL